MGILTIYTDIDTLFDTRRGILEHLIRETNKGHSWKDYEEVYKNRTLDLFEKPALGITQERYTERFSKRSIDDWVDDTCCYFYPTGIVGAILPIVRMIEYNECCVIKTHLLSLTVNCFPFVLTDTLKGELVKHLEAAFKVRIEIKLVSVGFEDQTAPYINGFNYVFRYGHLISKELSKWHETYQESVTMGTKIIVPDLLARPKSTDTVYTELNKEEVKALISKMSILQGGRCVFIPFSKGLFDYVTQ